MSQRQNHEPREPSAEHPITVSPAGQHVTVKVGGEVVADTRHALALQESTYPAVLYIPLGDVVQDRLARSETTTYCPYKGEANYFHVTTADGTTVDDAIWTYEQPYAAVADIAGHVAFYADKAEVAVSSG